MASRRKTTTPPKPWESPTSDAKAAGNYGRVYRALLKNENFLNLPMSARYLYLCMVTCSAGSREFHFTQGEAATVGIVGGTFRRSVNELIRAGFIRIKESGYTLRQPTIYEFVNNWRG